VVQYRVWGRYSPRNSARWSQGYLRSIPRRNLGGKADCNSARNSGQNLTRYSARNRTRSSGRCSRSNGRSRPRRLRPRPGLAPEARFGLAKYVSLLLRKYRQKRRRLCIHLRRKLRRSLYLNLDLFLCLDLNLNLSLFLFPSSFRSSFPTSFYCMSPASSLAK